MIAQDHSYGALSWMEDLKPIDFPARLAESKSRPGNSQDRQAKPAAASGQYRPAPQVVSFDRHELSIILNVYGRKVAEGEWRDYALDFMPNKAVFSIFRRTSEVPLFKVEKDPKLARKQGMYSVISATGLIMRRGTDLARVVSVLEKKLKVVR